MHESHHPFFMQFMQYIKFMNRCGSYISLAPTQHRGSSFYLSQNALGIAGHNVYFVQPCSESSAASAWSHYNSACRETVWTMKPVSEDGWTPGSKHSLCEWLRSLRDKWTPLFTVISYAVYEGLRGQTFLQSALNDCCCYVSAHQDLFVSWSWGVSGQSFCTKFMDT